MDSMTFHRDATGEPVLAPPPTTPAQAGHAPPAPSRIHRLWRGAEGDPTWARPALLGLLLATALFYFANLTSSGYANSFYSAAAQAGSASWKAFFYGSSDAGNSITVDKPPASLWAMALSVRLFGLSSFSILMPEVLMGVATVGVVHGTVKRHFGAAAGLIAGAVMALTPVAVLMFRFNNPDALLVLLMALAAWATIKSIEQGSARWFAIVGVLLGLGFLTKALQVLLVVPALGLAYVLFANTTLRRRITGAILGAGAMVLSAGWWVAIVELVPASMRPYIGGSQDNSFLSVTFGYNGLGRISGNETGSVGGGNGWGATGLGRMFSTSIGGQISWLIPSALILLAVGLFLRGRAPRTDGRRAAYVVWGGWLLVTMVTFSLMAGIFHEYYTVALAPAIAALVGMGAAEAWEHRAKAVGSVTLSAATAVAAAWSFVLLSRTDWQNWLRVGVLVLGLASALLLLAITQLHRRFVPAVIASALVAVLAGPAAYSVQTVSTGHTGSIVNAGPAIAGGGPGRGGMPGGPRGAMGAPPQQGTAGGPGATRGAGGIGGLLNASTPSTEVVSALSADASSYRWVAAAIGSQNAAGLQLGTGLPVMAIGGFNGSDPSPTLAQFQQYVADGDVHYFVASGNGDGPGGGRGGGLGGGPGGSGTGAQISQWVAATFSQVTIGGSTFYDLTRPRSSGTATSGSATTQST
ncbi:4-amino-4-deoxy-L-arabinose transferase-like glycosyltransferase [Phycicoccus badiiscoriae]|uniref:4-amino-4-deoxy-L-arabinose transferase-like glycosyltransferase n=1 Tax=Pedococcus badiiscoriae TaxID=642776 RepID=A0A852WJC2_9MICO|nr:glycosyltransferase family 39 protein [Pedococcus badiiscoriae]NYG06744.1 4-amino-4-deoxy-L-arabinose transferase-like glycosyltransferase [Pedococcus badiiscoriae]